MDITTSVVFGVFIFAVISTVLRLLWDWVRIHQRAYATPVYAYKYGMVTNKKGKVVSTKTPIYFDPKTGHKVLGKTIIENKRGATSEKRNRKFQKRCSHQ